MPEATLNILAVLILYGAFHSLTAAVGVKALFVSLMGQRAYLGLYRLFYNTLSVITLLPILLWAAAEPGAVVWETSALVTPLFLALQGIGALGGLVAILQIDSMRFLGLRQAMVWLEGGQLPLPDEPLSTIGLYRIVRHPLYLFGMMFLWFIPVMTEAYLGFALGATLYFALGSLLEEQKMRRVFGQRYIQYQREVPWLIPFVKWPTPPQEE